MEAAIEAQVQQAAKIVEDQLDAEIEKLDNLKDDDLESLREKRLQNLKQSQKQRDKYMQAGHGKYFEVADEKEFFEECKKSKNLVCHFFRSSTYRCKIVDKHLEILAGKHIETKFVKVDVERLHFLVERLNIRMLPTICCIKDDKTVDYIRGFDDLGGKDEFSTDMMEWRLAHSGCINYKGDLTTPPDDISAASSSKKTIMFAGKKSIRSENDADSDDADDW